MDVILSGVINIASIAKALHNLPSEKGYFEMEFGRYYEQNLPRGITPNYLLFFYNVELRNTTSKHLEYRVEAWLFNKRHLFEVIIPLKNERNVELPKVELISFEL